MQEEQQPKAAALFASTIKVSNRNKMTSQKSRSNAKSNV
jgi:hypothetical protein